MLTRALILFLLLAALTIGSVAQTGPVLTASALPMYPPLARQARIEGLVVVKFRLPAKGSEPKDVEIVSGPPMLTHSARNLVLSWRFHNESAVDHQYEMTFHYHLSGNEQRMGEPTKLAVTFELFDKVEVVADKIQVDTY